MSPDGPVTEVFKKLPALMAEHGVTPNGVLHVGGHHGEEYEAYRAAGFDRILWMEPNPELAQTMRDLGLEVVEAAAGSVEGEATFYVTDLTFWSSLQRPIRRKHHTINVEVRRIDSLDHGCNVLVVDTQGAEPDVIASADLDRFDLAVIETGTQQEYEGQVSFHPVDEAMAAAGFELAAEYWHAHNTVICDRVYARGDDG